MCYKRSYAAQYYHTQLVVNKLSVFKQPVANWFGCVAFVVETCFRAYFRRGLRIVQLVQIIDSHRSSLCTAVRESCVSA
jgi:hypothetical protein